MVDLDAEEVLDRFDLQLGAAVGVGAVDLLRALAGDFGVDVARDREFAEGAAAGPDQHQRVGAEFAFRAFAVRGVAVGLLLEALLRRRGAGLFRVRRAGVGSDHQDRLGAGQQQRVAVQRVLRFAGELEGLQLGGDGEGEEAERDPGQRPRGRPICGSFAPRLPLARQAELAPFALAPVRLLRGVAAEVAEARHLRLAEARKEAPPRPEDLVVGRPRGPLLTVVGHERGRNHGDARGRPFPAMSQAEAIGVDLGGTKMLVGVLDAETPKSPTRAARARPGRPRTSWSTCSSARSTRPARRGRGSPPPGSASRRRSTTTAGSRSPPSTCRSTTCRFASSSASAPGCRSSSTTTPTSPRSPSTSSARRAAPTTSSC